MRSESGADRRIDQALFAHLHDADAAYAAGRLDIEGLRLVLRALEQSRREDLMGIWSERAMQIDATNETSLFARASYYDRQGLPQHSLPLWAELSEHNPGFDPLGLHIGNALLAMGKIDDAFSIATAALDYLRTGHHVSARCATSQHYILRFHLLLSEVLLRHGDTGGFPHLLGQLGLRIPNMHIGEIAGWSGRPLDGQHILITPIGGYGDQWLYSALIPQLLRHVERITLAVHRDIAELMAYSLPNCRVIATDMPQSLYADASPEIHALIAEDRPDTHIPMLALPMVCSALNPDAPLQFPAYISVPPTENAISKLDNGKLRVGLAWDRAQRYFPDVVGGNEACRTARTSLPMEQLLELLADHELAQKYDFLALHESDALRSWPTIMPAHFHRADITGGDFVQTARYIASCDLIVSVDMSIANLAVFMGEPTWVLLNREGDWRWGESGASSPWIPQARTLRQATPGDWNSVTRALRGALLDFKGFVATRQDQVLEVQ